MRPIGSQAGPIGPNDDADRSPIGRRSGRPRGVRLGSIPWHLVVPRSGPGEPGPTGYRQVGLGQTGPIMGASLTLPARGRSRGRKRRPIEVHRGAVEPHVTRPEQDRGREQPFRRQAIAPFPRLPTSNLGGGTLPPVILGSERRRGMRGFCQDVTNDGWMRLQRVAHGILRVCVCVAPRSTPSGPGSRARQATASYRQGDTTHS